LLIARVQSGHALPEPLGKRRCQKPARRLGCDAGPMCPRLLSMSRLGPAPCVACHVAGGAPRDLLTGVHALPSCPATPTIRRNACGSKILKGGCPRGDILRQGGCRSVAGVPPSVEHSDHIIETVTAQDPPHRSVERDVEPVILERLRGSVKGEDDRPGPPGQPLWAVTIQRPSNRPSWTPNDSHRWMPGPLSPM
jgi:hypothetical protein